MSKSLRFFLLSFCVSIAAQAQSYKNWTWEILDQTRIPSKSNHVRDVLFDARGHAWVLFSDAVLLNYDGYKWVAHSPPDSLTGWFNDMDIDPWGRLWIAGGHEFLRVFDTRNLIWGKLDSPKKSQLFRVDCDPLGRILVGTNDNGRGDLLLYHDKRWSKIEARHEDVFSVQFDLQGRAIASYRDGTFRYAMNKKLHFSEEEEQLSEETFYELFFDRNERLWAASFTDFLPSFYTPKGWEELPAPPEKTYYDFNGKVCYVIHKIAPLLQQGIATGTQFEASLSIYHPRTGQWQSYVLPLEGPSDGISCIAESPSGHIWCGTWAHGLAIFKPGKGIPSRERTRLPKPVPVDPGPRIPGDIHPLFPD